MANAVVPNAALLDWLTAQIEDAPTLSDYWLRLYREPITITPVTTLAELEAIQCNYAGYVPKQLIDWTAPVIDDGTAFTEPLLATWKAEIEATGEIYGCYASSADHSRFWLACPFDAVLEVPLEAELQVAVRLDLRSLFTL